MSSRFTKQKYVAAEVLEDFSLPEKDQTIVKVIGSRGNNLHEVETPEGEVYLASMPTKFRRHIWIKRKDFVIVEPIAEGSKVKAEITRVLYRDQIRYIKQQGEWPSTFEDKSTENGEEPTFLKKEVQREDSDSEDSDSDGDLFVNTNRMGEQMAILSVSSSESETEDSSEVESEDSSQEGETG